jgi:hypothetical protein
VPSYNQGNNILLKQEINMNSEIQCATDNSSDSFTQEEVKKLSSGQGKNLLFSAKHFKDSDIARAHFFLQQQNSNQLK